MKDSSKRLREITLYVRKVFERHPPNSKNGELGFQSLNMLKKNLEADDIGQGNAILWKTP